ncbi:DUF2088 domain-containing protein [Candidatus Bipolaricaulota bacterium]|nr:DUF2088 domain-containing protein [Candidatus Bipolaricaulota bacterium]
MFSFVPGRTITDSEIKEQLGEALQGMPVRGKRVLIIIPDNTRTLPMPIIFKSICTALTPQAENLTFLVALGTHPPLTTEQLDQHLGPGWEKYPRVQVIQHEWDNPGALAQVGTIERDEMREISHGLLVEAVPIEINRAVLTHDLVFILGPVFPHEVVGFSGGHKYFFPGVSGPKMVHRSHWLGALITSPKTIGHKDTPVRAMIEKAATMVPTPCLGIMLVMRGNDLIGLFLGKVEDAWSKAADLSAKENIVWVKHPFHTVLAVAPAMYQELWTAGKCMYKLEPVVEDGGKVIIYAPNLHKISVTHGDLIREIGYHTRDYFLSQWDHFKDVPGAILAHSSHVRGIGTYRNKVEYDRIEVILSTQISETTCRAINLGYLNPNEVDLDHFADRQDDGVLLVPEAGEILYRLADGSVPDIDLL